MTAALAVEVLRLRTVRYPWLFLLAAELLVVAGVSGLALTADDLAGALPKAFAHVGLVAICSLVLGILSVAGEFRHRTITDTFLSFPHRTTPLLGKLAVTTLAGAVIGLVAAATAVAAAVVWWQVQDAAWDWTSDATLTLVGGVAWVMAFAAIGVALGAVVRNVMAAIAVGLGWIAVVEGVLGELVGSDAARWLPFAAGEALGRTGTIADPLSQGVAALVLAAYAGGLCLVAAFVTLGRDVT